MRVGAWEKKTGLWLFERCSKKQGTREAWRIRKKYRIMTFLAMLQKARHTGGLNHEKKRQDYDFLIDAPKSEAYKRVGAWEKKIGLWLFEWYSKKQGTQDGWSMRKKKRGLWLLSDAPSWGMHTRLTYGFKRQKHNVLGHAPSLEKGPNGFEREKWLNLELKRPKPSKIGQRKPVALEKEHMIVTLFGMRSN